MWLPLLLIMLALVFLGYFLYLFFLLNRSERLLQETILDIEASLLASYGQKRPQEQISPQVASAAVRDLLREKNKSPEKTSKA